MGGIPCWTHGMGHNVAATWRRSAAALTRLAPQPRFETAICGWQKHYSAWLRARDGVNERTRMAISSSFDRSDPTDASLSRPSARPWGPSLRDGSIVTGTIGSRNGTNVALSGL